MTTLYEKRGRRYVPVSDASLYERDTMRVGTFRLTYCYREGGQRYTYAVTPDTAAFVAAAEVAAAAMERAITKASLANVSAPTLYTKRELALIDEFRQRAQAIGLLMPAWWTHLTPCEIVYAGIDAARSYAP